MKTKENVILGIVEKTMEAYSFDRYGYIAWRRTIEYLLSKKINPPNIEKILLSKHMRWAVDMNCENVRLPGGEWVSYLTGDELKKYCKDEPLKLLSSC